MSINLGVVAVICFYFISGFLMRKSYARFKTHSNNPIFDFYIDRIIKLFPQYIIVVLVTIASIWFFGKSDVVTEFNQDITLSKVLLNIILLPANYVFYPLSIEALEPIPLIPPAWSLSSEFHFYLLLPLIFILNKRLWMLLLLITLGIQFSSFFYKSEMFNSDNFGYRYIFGVLTIFLYGYSFAEKKDVFYKWICILIWFAFALFLLVIAPAFNVFNNTLVQEILIGGFIALPLGYYFTTVKIQDNYKKIDNLLGDLAYPIFITHFLSFYLTEKLLFIQVENRVIFYISSITLCIIFSFLLSLMQKKVEIYRINRRGFKSLKAIKS